MRHDTTTSLTQPAPDCPYAVLLLFAMRRMAAGGLHDAFAVQAMLAGFGLGFRRPLVLLRAFMAEAARVSTVTITMAPCCCRRTTRGERALLGAMTLAIADPAAAHARLRATLQVRDCLGLVTSAQAVAAAFADLGMPLAAADG